MYDWIVYQGFKPVIVATKLDKINRSQVAKQVKLIRETLALPKDGILIPFSAETKAGRDEIWEQMEKLMPVPEEDVQKAEDTQRDE